MRGNFSPESPYRPRRMPIINSFEHIENNCAIFAMCGFPVTSGAGAGPAFDAIGNQPRSNDVMMRCARARCGASSMTPSICTTPAALASNAASTRSAQWRGAGGPRTSPPARAWRQVFRPRRRLAVGVNGILKIEDDDVRATLHGVVFAILGPAQRSTPSGTRRRRCFAPRRSDATSSHHALGAGKSNHDLPEMAALLHKFQRFRHSIEGDGSVDDRL
jgi:hypothetical protein